MGKKKNKKNSNSKNKNKQNININKSKKINAVNNEIKNNEICVAPNASNKKIYTDFSNEIKLDDNKKNDIKNLFSFNQNNNDKRINKWKIYTISLIILSISLIFLLINVKLTNKNADNKPLCEVEKENIVLKEETKKEEQKNDKKQKEKKYLFLGDSLFSLYNTSEYFRDYNTINSGVSGITAKETYDVLEENVYAHNPDVIFILLGTNDLYKEYSTSETFENIKNVIDKIHIDKPEVTIYVLSLLPINTIDHWMINKEINANRTNEKIDEVNKYLQSYCEENKFEYINIHDTLLDNEDNLKLEYTKEGLHVNDIGYHFITNILLKYFK